MITRVALLAASLSASAVLAVGLALMGVGPTAPATVTAPPLEPVAATDGAPLPVTQIDTVYVVPTPSSAPDPTPPTIVIKKYVTAGGGENEQEGDD